MAVHRVLDTPESVIRRDLHSAVLPGMIARSEARLPRPGADDPLDLQPSRDVYEEAIESLIARGSPQAVVISCAALRMADILPALNERFSIPLMTSNQAMASSIKQLKDSASITSGNAVH